MIDVEVFSKAGIGKHNEDYVLHTEIAPNISLIVVCDGMGGLSYGADASKIIAHSIEKHLKQNLCSQLPEQSIINAILYANDVLAKECTRLKTKMGASVALALLIDNNCYYTWLGDVRIYITKDDELPLLTNDHLAMEGNHSFLTSCINGREFRKSPIVRDFEAKSNMDIIISTDGFYLFNDINTSLENIVINYDDASIVKIRFS